MADYDLSRYRIMASYVLTKVPHCVLVAEPLYRSVIVVFTLLCLIWFFHPNHSTLVAFEEIFGKEICVS